MNGPLLYVHHSNSFARLLSDLNFLWARSLFLYASKHSASNQGALKSFFMVILGICLSTSMNKTVLKFDQAISGYVRSIRALQGTLPRSSFS